VSAQTTQTNQEKTAPIQPPTQCDPNDFACIALQYNELYKYAVGTEGCIDPPACTKRGKRPAELLSGLFKACAEEAGGDFGKFEACVSDLAQLLEAAGRRAFVFK